MLSVPLPFPNASLDLGLPFPGWPLWVRMLLTVGLAAVLAFLLIRLYRYETRLVPRRLALALLGLRLATAAAVFLILAFDPALAFIDKEPVPSRVLVAVDRSDSMRVNDPQRSADEKQALISALRLENSFAKFDTTTRLKLAEQALVPAGADVLNALANKHAVELIGFDQNFSPLPQEPDKLRAALDSDRQLDTKAATPNQSFTDLKLPFARAAESSGVAQGSKLVGVVVFTDGRHNWGDSPLPRVQELAARKIPVYSVVCAPTDAPPDVAVVAAKAQAATVFKGSTVPVEVSVRVSGWPAGPVTVTLTPPPDEKGNKRPPVVETIRHDGKDQTYQFALKARMDAPGPQSMTVTAESASATDKFPSNNTRIVRVNVVKDRARVMLVDGEARWEFHYLQTCLGRDENMDVRSVVFRQPRITRATDEDLKAFGIPARRLPDDADVLTGYDCVVLGDAEPEQLDAAARARLEKYVGEDGGTLVMVAGKRAMPLGFTGDADPLRKLLPVRNPKAVGDDRGFQLALTPDGQRSWFLMMGDTGAQSRAVWENFPPHLWAVTGEPKDAAETLATLNGLPVVVRQNYGFGRVLYVGIDSTWRWRFKAGDVHHHRFWGQVAQWAASDRLLPTQNPAGTIRFGTREPAFRSGQEVEVVARGTEAVKKLTPAALKGARVVKLPTKEGEAEKPHGLVPFTQPDGRPRDLTAKLRDLTPGKYAVELEIPDWADQLQGGLGPDGRAVPLRSAFEVLPPDDEELVELSADLPLLESIAAATGGKVYPVEKVRELVDKLAAQQATEDHRTETRARRSWWTLAVVLALLVAEWGLRKWAGLP